MLPAAATVAVAAKKNTCMIDMPLECAALMNIGKSLGV